MNRYQYSIKRSASPFAIVDHDACSFCGSKSHAHCDGKGYVLGNPVFVGGFRGVRCHGCGADTFTALTACLECGTPH